MGFKAPVIIYVENSTLKTVFLMHSQTPLYPLIVGLSLKLNLYPYISFFINTVCASLFSYYSYQTLKIFLNKHFLITILTILLMLNPALIYLQFLSGWENNVFNFDNNILLLLLQYLL